MAEEQKDPQEAVIAALQTFVEDIEVVGLAHARATWPDLLVTYKQAVAALEGVGRYESDLEPDEAELEDVDFDEGFGERETVDDIRPLG